MKTKRIRGILLVVLIPICLLLLVYMMVSVYYSGHFFPGTWINGLNCSNKSVTRVMKDLEEHRSSYALRLQGRDDKEELLSSEDIGYLATYEGVKTVKKEQGMWSWITKMSDINFYTVESKPGFEEDKLRDALEALELVNGSDVKAPEDAYIDYTDGIKVVPEVLGTTLDVKKLYDVIAEAIKSDKYRVNLDAEDCYVKPKVTRETKEFKELIAPMDAITGVTITLKVGEDVTEVIDETVTSDWLYQETDGSIGIDEEKVYAYMKQMEEKYETIGKTRQFKNSYGNTVSVAPGNYGWSINVKKETAQIIEELRAGKDVTRDINNDATARTWNDDTFGDTYVEISIDNQRMWFYKNGSLVVDTAIVTGNVNKGHSTPKGAYTLNNKQMYVTLTSTNPDDPYESKVTYWLPFIGNAYGLHDASWRSSYGGSIYRYNGSHGCVNTPYYKIQAIYENIEIGTPIIIY